MTTPYRKKSKVPKVDLATQLLAWYDRHARSMPWRLPPTQGKQACCSNPYHVWLSEVMLQQTQVATVRDYFLKFVAQWPRVEDLASANIEDVMKAWAGLGYYSRARNLKKCADIVVAEHNGQFPDKFDGLKKLPGVGDYTAAAIAAIAFGQPVAVVDGNVERVIARIFRISAPMPQAKPKIREIVSTLLCKQRPGDFAQAMMDLGARVCTPKNPACPRCPLAARCAAFAKHDMAAFPVKAPKKFKPTRRGAAFVIVNHSGAIFLRRRRASGLLGGMSEVPTSDWNSRGDGAVGIAAAPFKAKWQSCGAIQHTFTHYHLELEVWKIESQAAPDDGWWSGKSEIAGEALPSVMKKAIAACLPEAFRQPERSETDYS